MGTGVGRPMDGDIFWLKAACWEPPPSTYANLETAHINLFSSRIQFAHINGTYEVRVVYMQQVKAYQRGVLCITQSRATKAKAEEKTALLGTVGRTFNKTFLKKVTPGC